MVSKRRAKMKMIISETKEVEVKTSEDFHSYLSKRYYDFTHSYFPIHGHVGMHIQRLMDMVSKQEAIEIVNFAESIGEWHPDTIAFYRERNCGN
jgi:hypothetical protein